MPAHPVRHATLGMVPPGPRRTAAKPFRVRASAMAVRWRSGGISPRNFLHELCLQRNLSGFCANGFQTVALRVVKPAENASRQDASSRPLGCAPPTASTRHRARATCRSIPAALSSPRDSSPNSFPAPAGRHVLATEIAARRVALRNLLGADDETPAVRPRFRFSVALLSSAHGRLHRLSLDRRSCDPVRIRRSRIRRHRPRRTRTVIWSILYGDIPFDRGRRRQRPSVIARMRRELPFTPPGGRQGAEPRSAYCTVGIARMSPS